MTEVNCSTEALVEAAAHAAYEANRAYCAAIGELSGLSWADAEKWRPLGERARVAAGVHQEQRAQHDGR